ncbi:MAG: hypothetical protein QFE16_04565 [Pseudomonadota bacterium]|nr:hypothetical protein [Pseudomonadota bacterium]
MKFGFHRSQIALAAIAAMGATAMTTAPTVANAAKTAGTYVTGDIHNHTTCSDGSISMQKLVKKATDTWGLDWFVQAGHGGNGNRNCTLAEDSTATAGGGSLSGAAVTSYAAQSTYDPTLGTLAYPITTQGPTTTWQNSSPAVAPKGLASGTSPNANMWRWQSIQEFQYPLVEYLSAVKNKPLFIGVESVVAGHEHTSMSVITGQMPTALDSAILPTGPVVAANTSRYTALGNADALAKWEYCFDRADTDTSRGGGQGWDCSVAGSVSASGDWNATAAKLTNNSGTAGHNKTVDAVKWMAQNAPLGSYYVPAHLERAGPFNPAGSNGFNIEHLRDFNNAAPAVAFAMETQPGHGASSNRGEYQPHRNSIGGVNVDSVGGTTYGGTGVYGAQIGGVWDALLGEGRNWWFSASSDWHNRGVFGTDDRRTTQDFQPGEYQRNFVMVRNGTDPKLRPQTIVDGMRSGNNFAASGQLIDRMAFIACASYTGIGARTNASVEALAVTAATNNTDIDKAGCATMGEKLVVRPGAEIVVSIVVRDPSGTNNAPYTFNNPSLTQIGVSQPLNAPVLDHVDLIRGMVTGYKTPGATDYSGQWPNTWLANTLSGMTTAQLMATVPAAAKNTSAAILSTFNNSTWTTVAGNTDYKKMTFRIPAVAASQYVRLRGSNLPANVPFETDPNGNPLTDLYTNASSYSAAFAGGTGYDAAAATNTNLKIQCNVTSGSTQFDHCPDHLASISGQKYSSYDVAAWADLWFYSNPIYVEVTGMTNVAGVK